MVFCITITACSAKRSLTNGSPASTSAKSEAAAPKSNSKAADSAQDNAGIATDAASSSADQSQEKPGDLDVRKLIKSVSLTIQTKTFDDFMSNLQSEIQKYGGYVQKSNITGNSYTSTSNRSAMVVAKIPADKLEEFTSLVSSIGNVTSKTENVQDVTSSYVDTESQIKALKAEQDSLLKLLEKSGNLNDILSVQDRLTKVRSQLESYEAQMRTYDNLIAYSTVTMDIQEVEQIQTIEKLTMWQQIGNNLSKNLSDIGHGFKGFFIWFVSVLPYLILIAAFAVVILLIVRRINKKRKSVNNELPPLFPPNGDNEPK